MQVLTLKRRDEAGRETTVGVKVLRSWQDGSGRQVYLHTNGVYGYKDGSPVRSKSELEAIGSSVAREMAYQWWEATGKDLSAQYYREIEEKERARQADFYEPGYGDSQTELDQVMYKLREKGKKTWGQPFSWMEKFSSRPDWWGQAESIVLKGVEYKKVDLAAAETTGDLAANEV